MNLEEQETFHVFPKQRGCFSGTFYAFKRRFQRYFLPKMMRLEFIVLILALNHSESLKSLLH